MLETLNIACIEDDLLWESPEKNRKQFDEKFKLLSPQTDLVLLPEMFTTGFSMQPELFAELPQGETLQWMQDTAKRYDFLLGGSYIVKENNNYYNRFLFVLPDGTTYSYNKRHLFHMGKENERYACGTERVVVHYKGWRMLPQICYDLRFPVWSRNKNDYDLLIYVANFPAKRKHVWDTLLNARAIENQCFVVGCNRTGTDGMGIYYSGDSQIVSPKGEILSTPISAKIIHGTVSLTELQHFRKQFPVSLDADSFSFDVQ